jgi:hypothetical protein
MQRRRLLGGMAAGAAAVGLSACSQTLVGQQSTGVSTTDVSELPVLGEAPELIDTTWINSEPLTLASFKGNSVVGLAFWTYG